MQYLEEINRVLVVLVLFTTVDYVEKRPPPVAPDTWHIQKGGWAGLDLTSRVKDEAVKKEGERKNEGFGDLSRAHAIIVVCWDNFGRKTEIFEGVKVDPPETRVGHF